MIGRRGKALRLAYVAFLTVLFLMCSTDLIIREPEREVYQIAVIIEDVRDDNYVNFRKGIEQAAMEFHGDVQFITLYKRLDGDQQIELMSREQQDGAHALIIIPADEERVVSALAQGQVSVPVVLLGSGQAGEGAAGTIAPDHKAMGECLAREMAVRMDEGCQAVIFEETGRKSAMDRLFLEGAKDVFDQEGIRWMTVRAESTGPALSEAVLALGSRGREEGRTMILAQSTELLTEIAGIFGENHGLFGAGASGKTREYGPGQAGSLEGAPSSHGGVGGLYGRGSTLGVLNYLDQGLITGICVTDQFSLGYRSVEMAIQALEAGGGHRRLKLDSYYIEKEDLRRPEYEMLLYPVE